MLPSSQARLPMYVGRERKSPPMIFDSLPVYLLTCLVLAVAQAIYVLLGFGAGLIGGYTVHLLSRAGVATSFEHSEIAAFMMVVYAIATLVGERRYA